MWHSSAQPLIICFLLLLQITYLFRAYPYFMTPYFMMPYATIAYLNNVIFHYIKFWDVIFHYVNYVILSKLLFSHTCPCWMLFEICHRTANDCNVDTHANILTLFLIGFCLPLCVHMFCARVLAVVHRLYSVQYRYY